MSDDETRIQVEQLRKRLSEAAARKAALLGEVQEFAAQIGEVRAALGNPYFYSGENWQRPENADESIANYTAYRSHEPGLHMIQRLRRVDRELTMIREQLLSLGETV